MRSRARFLALVVLLAACGSSQEPAPVTPVAPPPSPEAMWAEAEQVAAAYVVAREGAMKQPVLGRHPTIPYLFEVFMVPRAVLVHRGKVVEERGVPALRRYVDDAGLLDAPTPTATDMIGLVYALSLWPRTGDDPTAFAPLDDARAPLRPQVSRRDRAIVLQLYYTSSSGVGSTSTASTVDEYTLTIPPTGDPAWTHKQRQFDGERVVD